MLPDTFGVFVLTHKRPNNVLTFDTLRECGYSGRLYLIVDNEDDTVGQYYEKFGTEHVVVFDKQAEVDVSDYGNNFNEYRTTMIVRNASFKIAEQLGITHFVQLDDDYTAFEYRVMVDGKGIVRPVKNIDSIFSETLEFYKASGATAISFAQGGDFIGAIYNGVAAYRFSRRKCMNSIFCSVERPFKFVGVMNEDVNTYTTLGSRGYLFLTIPVISIVQKATQAQKGGMAEMYRKFGTYSKAFTTSMMMPSSVRVGMLQSGHPRIHHIINWKATVPCIVSEAYRKNNTEES